MFLLKFFALWISFLSQWIPRSIWRKWVGSPLAFLWIDVFKARKKIILSNLDIAFPELSVDEKNKIGRESVYRMAENFSEVFRLPHIRKAWFEENICFHGWEHVEGALLKNKGIYFLALHMGNGDLTASAIVNRGLPLYLISKKFKTKWFNNLWFFIRGSKGVKYIEAHGQRTAFDILNAIKEKASVVFVLDQFMGPPYGIATTFFGKITGTAYGLALFYLKTQTPVLPIYSYEGTDGRVHICIDPVMDLDSCFSQKSESDVIEENNSKNKKEIQILCMTQKFNDKIEEIIRRHPEEWLWVHRRWKEFRLPMV